MTELAVFGAGLAMTSGSLAVLHTTSATPHPVLEVLVLTAANLLVTLMRFLAMRLWIFRETPHAVTPPGG